MRELAADSLRCSLITDEQSPRSSRVEGKEERKRKRANEYEFPIDGSKSARLEGGRVSSPSDDSPTSLFSYSDVTSDEEENIYHNIREFFSEPNLEGDEAALKVCNEPSSVELRKQGDIELKNDKVHPSAEIPVAIPRQSVFKEDAEEYLSLTVAKLRRRLLAAQVQMSLLTSPQLQGDLPVFVERAMHLFYQHNQHLLMKKPSGTNNTNPGKASAATATASTFDVERRLFVDQALQLYLQQFMPSAED